MPMIEYACFVWYGTSSGPSLDLGKYYMSDILTVMSCGSGKAGSTHMTTQVQMLHCKGSGKRPITPSEPCVWGQKTHSNPYL